MLRHGDGGREIITKRCWAQKRHTRAKIPRHLRYLLAIRAYDDFIKQPRIQRGADRIGDYGLATKGLDVFERDALGAAARWDEADFARGGLSGGGLAGSGLDIGRLHVLGGFISLNGLAWLVSLVCLTDFVSLHSLNSLAGLVGLADLGRLASFAGFVGLAGFAGMVRWILARQVIITCWILVS